VPRPKIRILSGKTAIHCALIAFMLATWPQGARSQTPNATISLREYENQLADYSRRIEENKQRPAEIAQIRGSLPSAWQVEHDGEAYRVSTSRIADALSDLQVNQRNANQKARDIESALGDLRRSAVALEDADRGASISTATADLNQVLKGQEFTGLRGPTRLQILEARIGDWISGWLIRLLSHVHIGVKTGNALAWMVIVLAFALICYWVYRTVSRRVAMDELPVTSSASPSDARLWVREAMAAADRGDYREAVHCAYWAAIARLEDLKLLKRDRARTPRESLKLLTDYPAEQNSLRDLTGRFELIWYGYSPASQTDWSAAKNLLEKFGCLAASTAPTANS
jgi:hypothetical protein